MVTVKLVRTEREVEDERVPLLIGLSRVPFLGEYVSLIGAQRDGRDAMLADIRKVLMVTHMCHPEVAARIVLAEMDD